MQIKPCVLPVFIPAFYFCASSNKLVNVDFIWSHLLSLFASLVIAVFGFIYLPPSFNSFDQENHPFVLDKNYIAYNPFVAE